MILGAIAGAVIGAATSVVTQAASGKPVNFSKVAKQAAVGAVTGDAERAAGQEAKSLESDAERAVTSDGERTGTEEADQGVGAACSLNNFDPSTSVATPNGPVPIRQLQVGDSVTAYNPATGQPQTEPVKHVFINHDTNLLDVTLAPVMTTARMTPTDDPSAAKQHQVAVAAHGAQAPPPETLHTTTEHPLLTTDGGFVNAQDLRVGERVQRLDGSVGVVLAVAVTLGAVVRYNLTVQDVHTYAVGVDCWVVHNCGDTPDQIRQCSKKRKSTMGAWGPRIFQDDIAIDVRLAFEEAFARHCSVKEATQQALEDFGWALADMDDGATIFIALAVLQLQHHALQPTIQEKALQAIVSEDAIARWEGMPPAQYDARKLVLERLMQMLNTGYYQDIEQLM